MAVTLNPETWVNWPMAKSPLNWLIVGVVASIWLMAFHAVMTGFSAMQAGSGTGQAVGGGGPGSIAAPLAPVTTAFSQPGITGTGFGNSWFGVDPYWTDGFEAKYAEDGWTGDYT